MKTFKFMSICIIVFIMSISTLKADNSKVKKNLQNDSKQSVDIISALYGKDAGEIAIERIMIGNIEFNKTAEVYVINPSKIGESITTINGTIPDFIDSSASRIAKGVFVKGRTVQISPYIMGKYQVTQELYTAVMIDQKIGEKQLSSEPFYCKEDGIHSLTPGEIQKYRAAEGMTWYDAVYFCNVLTEKTMNVEDKVYNITNIVVNADGNITYGKVTADISKKGYRLPTEAEWEFAARGGNTLKADWNYLFSGASTGKVSYEENSEVATYISSKNTGFDSVGWYYYNTVAENAGKTGDITPLTVMPGSGIHEVGKKECNALGIYDMSGNVSEWCYDGYEDYLHEKKVLNPIGREDYFLRVTRGGDCFNTADIGTVCWRGHGLKAGSTFCNVGIRLVRSVSE